MPIRKPTRKKPVKPEHKYPITPENLTAEYERGRRERERELATTPPAFNRNDVEQDAIRKCLHVLDARRRLLKSQWFKGTQLNELDEIEKEIMALLPK